MMTELEQDDCARWRNEMIAMHVSEPGAGEQIQEWAINYRLKIVLIFWGCTYIELSHQHISMQSTHEQLTEIKIELRLIDRNRVTTDGCSVLIDSVPIHAEILEQRDYDDRVLLRFSLHGFELEEVTSPVSIPSWLLEVDNRTSWLRVRVRQPQLNR